jgi:acetyltransferase-like isoleucine patch superfamily enzyme
MIEASRTACGRSRRDPSEESGARRLWRRDCLGIRKAFRHPAAAGIDERGSTPPVSADCTYIHELADVEEGAVLGEGTRVWRFAHIRSGAVIGNDCVLGNSVFVDCDVRIGSGVKVQNGVSVYAGVTVEDDAFLGPHMTFTNDMYPRSYNPEWNLVPTWVERGAAIGAHATILCGTRIGAYSMVAAGAVVTRDVPAFGLVVGSPARLVGRVCYCGRRVVEVPIPYDYRGQEVTCPACGTAYRIDEAGEFLPPPRVPAQAR